VIFARLNQERLELSKRKREISGKELASDFQAQITLFDQSVINFLELSQTPEKCDEYDQAFHSVGRNGDQIYRF
jgi:hypothetical protein